MSGKEDISNESDKNLVQASVPSKFNNWQRLFTHSTITVKMSCLLALQVCLHITPLLILLLRNHGFWIAEQPITLHLIHDFSHTLHHHLFQMLICPQAQLRSSHLRAQLNSMTMFISKITSSLNCCVVQDLAMGRMIGSGKQHAGLYYMSLFQSPRISNIDRCYLWHKRLGYPSPACLQLVSSLLPIPINKNLIPFIIIVVFVLTLNRQGYHFL